MKARQRTNKDNLKYFVLCKLAFNITSWLFNSVHQRNFQIYSFQMSHLILILNCANSILQSHKDICRYIPIYSARKSHKTPAFKSNWFWRTKSIDMSETAIQVTAARSGSMWLIGCIIFCIIFALYFDMFNKQKWYYKIFFRKKWDSGS